MSQNNSDSMKLQVVAETQISLLALLKDKKGGLPTALNEPRWLQNTLYVLTQTKGIEKMKPDSIARVLVQGAFLNLDFLSKECYAIPYGNELQFQTDYKGEIKVTRMYSISPVREIYAKLIREGDHFEEIVSAGIQTVDFRPLRLNDGAIEGAFAVVQFDDGTMRYESMTLAEILEVRDNYAKTDAGGQHSKAWRKSPGEMYKKTVFRRLCKGITLDFGSTEQQTAWDQASIMEFKKAEKKVQTAASSLDPKEPEMINVTPDPEVAQHDTN